MISIVTLVASVLAQVAPGFLVNLRRNKNASEYAQKVKQYIDQNIAPLRSSSDVANVVEVIKRDPVVTQQFMDQLLDSERAVIDRELADRADARRTFGDSGAGWQPAVVLGMSFAILGGIIAATTWFMLAPPDLPENQTQRDFVIQTSGAVMGFLTGIGGMFARSFSSVFDYFYGSSFGSKQKTEQIGKLVEAAATDGGAKTVDVQGGGQAKVTTETTIESGGESRLDIFRRSMKAGVQTMPVGAGGA